MFSRHARRLAFLPLPLVLLFFAAGCSQPAPAKTEVAADGYLFCFWNVENFFDDRDDHRNGDGDKEYDGWFARHPEMLQAKLDHLSEALIKLNGGKGPDIIALAEVESLRSAELLQQALDKRLSDESLHYKNLLMKDITGGRHIATAILTRLPVNRNKTQIHGRGLRILEGHIDINGHDLVVIASHWTSRLPRKKDGQTTHGEDGRTKYGDQIYGVYKGMYLSNPQVDFLVCGDFNDTPQDEPVVKHLHAVGESDQVLQAPRDQPLLLNLFVGKNAKRGPGTIYNEGKWAIFDQFAVSPGLLDTEGWICDVESATIVNTLTRPGDRNARPWRFGGEKDNLRPDQRGYSDHFPVTVRLRVAD